MSWRRCEQRLRLPRLDIPHRPPARKGIAVAAPGRRTRLMPPVIPSDPNAMQPLPERRQTGSRPTLFAAGPPDSLDEGPSVGHEGNPARGAKPGESKCARPTERTSKQGEVRITRRRSTVAAIFFPRICRATAPANPVRDRAEEILRATGIPGGLIVHVGCGNGKLTAALHSGDGCLVRGLDADLRNMGNRTASPGPGCKIPQLKSELRLKRWKQTPNRAIPNRPLSEGGQ